MLARIALAWVTAISLCHVGITNYQVTRVQRYHDRYVAVLFNDWVGVPVLPSSTLHKH